jgi:type II secretory pathway component PulL
MSEQTQQNDFKQPETPTKADSLVGVASTDLFVALVRRHNLAVNDLTETQLAEAIRQAMPDFRRYVHVTGQMVMYLPRQEAERYRTLYHELLLSVESIHEGETRHDTALRYIRERETHSSVPSSDSSANLEIARQQNKENK